jgi:Lhr-like helicase
MNKFNVSKKLRLISSTIEGRQRNKAEENLLSKLIELSSEFDSIEVFRHYMIQLRNEKTMFYDEKGRILQKLTKQEELDETLTGR